MRFADTLLPESQTFEHLLDHFAFVDEGHNPHLALAVRADEGIGFPDFLDEFAPVATPLRFVAATTRGPSPFGRLLEGILRG